MKPLSTSPARTLAIVVLVAAALAALYLDQRATQDSAAIPPAADAGRTGDGRLAEGNGFDFYVLSLSWSPSYCEAEGEDANRQQCASGRPYAFVVHGLWPQFEKGYPETCATDDPTVPDGLVRSLYDLMPSAGLIRHQWRKHGTCSGLSQADYFAVLRAAREKVAIPGAYRRLDDYMTVDPDAVERDFRDANGGLPGDGVAVTCDRRYLREVRICMTRDLSFRPCPEVDRRACALDRTVMPPVRGG